jgi:hypothetical protein
MPAARVTPLPDSRGRNTESAGAAPAIRMTKTKSIIARLPADRRSMKLIKTRSARYKRDPRRARPAGTTPIRPWLPSMYYPETVRPAPPGTRWEAPERWIRAPCRLCPHAHLSPASMGQPYQECGVPPSSVPNLSLAVSPAPCMPAA